jgi:hypothetical protein
MCGQPTRCRRMSELWKDERMSLVARLRTSVERRPVVSFYLLAFAIPWMAWLPQTARGRGLGSLHRRCGPITRDPRPVMVGDDDLRV